MPPQSNQQQNPQLDVNSARASMGIATRLNEQLLQHQNPMQEQQGAGQTQPQGETPEDPKIQKIADDVDKLKEQVKGKDVQKEIDNIRAELEAVLKDEGQETPEPNESPE